MPRVPLTEVCGVIVLAHVGRHAVGPHRVGQHGRLVPNDVEELELVGRVERCFTEQKAVERDAEGPDVDALAHGRALAPAVSPLWQG